VSVQTHGGLYCTEVVLLTTLDKTLKKYVPVASDILLSFAQGTGTPETSSLLTIGWTDFSLQRRKEFPSNLAGHWHVSKGKWEVPEGD
jgi:hypothetical protein